MRAQTIDVFMWVLTPQMWSVVSACQPLVPLVESSNDLNSIHDTTLITFGNTNTNTNRCDRSFGLLPPYSGVQLAVIGEGHEATIGLTIHGGDI